jgi:hypothetical protein
LQISKTTPFLNVLCAVLEGGSFVKDAKKDRKKRVNLYFFTASEYTENEAYHHLPLCAVKLRTSGRRYKAQNY